VAFGNGTFLASSREANVMWASSNGTYWSRQETGFPASHIYGVEFGNGIFVAVGTGGPLIWTSPDGRTWTGQGRETVAARGLYRIGFLNGLFVALGGYSNIGRPFLTSPDGVVWTERTGTWQDRFDVLLATAYGDGRYVIVGQHGMILTSEDGTTWQTLPDRNQAAPSFSSVAYGNGTFAATFQLDAPQVDTNVVVTSSEGSDWTARLKVPAEGGSPTHHGFP
jgi:hypothetical protein